MAVWRMNLIDNRKLGNRCKDQELKFRICIEKSIVGIGWGLNACFDSWEEYHTCADYRYHENKGYTTAANALKEMACGDLVWTQNPVTHERYLAQVLDSEPSLCCHLREFLFYCGLQDKIDEIMPHITAIPVVMPYITSQFMPRRLKDRPEVIPAGNKNLAFIGQFVELEGDVVFTVETSVRTAMIAVYRMLHLDRPITPLFQGQYDIRMVNVALKTLLGKDKIEVSDLPKVNPLKLPQTMHEIVNAINQIPPVPEYYSERKENR